VGKKTGKLCDRDEKNAAATAIWPFQIGSCWPKIRVSQLSQLQPFCKFYTERACGRYFEFFQKKVLQIEIKISNFTYDEILFKRDKKRNV